MKKSKVIRGLSKTLSKVKSKLNDYKFRYDIPIYDFAETARFVVVGSIEGYYPLWYPNSIFEYRMSKLDSIGYYDIKGALSVFHGINEELVEVLFYGDSYRNGDIYIENSKTNSLSGVIIVWENIIDLIKKDKIEWRIQENLVDLEDW